MPLIALNASALAVRVYSPTHYTGGNVGVRVTPRRNNIMVCYGYYADYAVSVQSRTSNSNWGGRVKGETEREGHAASCSVSIYAGEKGEMCGGGDRRYAQGWAARPPLTD